MLARQPHDYNTFNKECVDILRDSSSSTATERKAYVWSLQISVSRVCDLIFVILDLVRMVFAAMFLVSISALPVPEASTFMHKCFEFCDHGVLPLSFKAH